jgi:hypothetical protein
VSGDHEELLYVNTLPAESVPKHAVLETHVKFPTVFELSVVGVVDHVVPDRVTP